MTDRAEYVKGLRILADLLEANEDVPLPWHGTGYSRLNWIISADLNQRETLARIARLIPGVKTKSVYQQNFNLEGWLAGLKVGVIAERDEVCERVVTNTREVTKKIPDPNAPLVEITETVEDVEWRCAPILEEATS